MQLKEEVEDRWTWIHDVSNCYSTKSAYKARLRDQKLWSVVWKSLAPVKTCAFAWRLILERIPSKWNLANMGSNLSVNDLLCVWSKAEPKTMNHLFLSWHFSYRM
ncbi:hypothetical protein Lal_00032865 [Lupinus albus]|nr:hypothetical protein Lal_00032865 [Lupinus albus]